MRVIPVLVLGGSTRQLFSTLLQHPIASNQRPSFGAALYLLVEIFKQPFKLFLTDVQPSRSAHRDFLWEIMVEGAYALLVVNDGTARVQQDMDFARALAPTPYLVILPDLTYPALIEEIKRLLNALFDEMDDPQTLANYFGSEFAEAYHNYRENC